MFVIWRFRNWNDNPIYYYFYIFSAICTSQFITLLPNITYVTWYDNLNVNIKETLSASILVLFNVYNFYFLIYLFSYFDIIWVALLYCFLNFFEIWLKSNVTNFYCNDFVWVICLPLSWSFLNQSQNLVVSKIRAYRAVLIC